MPHGTCGQNLGQNQVHECVSLEERFELQKTLLNLALVLKELVLDKGIGSA